MMLPIMVGLQMAISVSQLEQGEQYFPDLGNVRERWSDKEEELEAKLLAMPNMPINDAGPWFIENAEDVSHVMRVYRSGQALSACFVPKVQGGFPDLKCTDEVVVE
jgi:hypothetical protein